MIFKLIKLIILILKKCCLKIFYHGGWNNCRGFLLELSLFKPPLLDMFTIKQKAIIISNLKEDSTFAIKPS